MPVAIAIEPAADGEDRECGGLKRHAGDDQGFSADVSDQCPVADLRDARRRGRPGSQAACATLAPCVAGTAGPAPTRSRR